MGLWNSPHVAGQLTMISTSSCLLKPNRFVIWLHDTMDAICATSWHPRPRKVRKKAESMHHVGALVDVEVGTAIGILLGDEEGGKIQNLQMRGQLAVISSTVPTRRPNFPRERRDSPEMVRRTSMSAHKMLEKEMNLRTSWHSYKGRGVDDSTVGRVEGDAVGKNEGREKGNRDGRQVGAAEGPPLGRTEGGSCWRVHPRGHLRPQHRP